MADSHAVSGSHGSADAHGPDGEHGAHQVHWKQYVVIGAILTIITGVEVAIFYIEALASVLVPALIVLSAAKFILVVLYYMHLRIDSPVFGRVFWAPLLLAAIVVVSMIMLFKVLPKYGVFS